MTRMDVNTNRHNTMPRLIFPGFYEKLSFHPHTCSTQDAAFALESISGRFCCPRVLSTRTEYTGEYTPSPSKTDAMLLAKSDALSIYSLLRTAQPPSRIYLLFK